MRTRRVAKAHSKPTTFVDPSGFDCRCVECYLPVDVRSGVNWSEMGVLPAMRKFRGTELPKSPVFGNFKVEVSQNPVLRALRGTMITSVLPTNRTTQRKPFRICGSELPLTVIGKRPCAGTAVLALVHFL